MPITTRRTQPVESTYEDIAEYVETSARQAPIVGPRQGSLVDLMGVSLLIVYTETSTLHCFPQGTHNLYAVPRKFFKEGLWKYLHEAPAHA